MYLLKLLIVWFVLYAVALLYEFRFPRSFEIPLFLAGACSGVRGMLTCVGFAKLILAYRSGAPFFSEEAGARFITKMFAVSAYVVLVVFRMLAILLGMAIAYLPNWNDVGAFCGLSLALLLAGVFDFRRPLRRLKNAGEHLLLSFRIMLRQTAPARVSR